MESIHVSELRETLVVAKLNICQALNDLIDTIDTKILVGNIHVPVEKKVRKKRTRKVKAVAVTVEFPPPKTHAILPDADTGKAGEFFKKKREKKIDGGE